MYYEINVSLNGQHFFATHKRSITNRMKLNNVLDVIQQKFPAEEGYQITVTKYVKTGYILGASGE